MSQEQATVAEEEYLQIIYWLQEAGLPITGANIARAMQVSAPTVHEMIGRLEDDGYVTRDADKTLTFTDSGREHAVARGGRLVRVDVELGHAQVLALGGDVGHDRLHDPARRTPGGREVDEHGLV